MMQNVSEMETSQDQITNNGEVERLGRSLAGAAHYNFRESWQPKDIVFSRGKSMSLYDVEGRRYIDLYANFGANILGHGHAAYQERIFHDVTRMSSPPLSDLSAQVSETLCALIPSAEKVRFCVSGTEAVQTAIRLARAHTGKQKFLRFNGHYHGHTDNFLGGRPSQDDCPVPEDFDGDARASEGIAAHVREEQSILTPWNDLSRLEEIVRAYHEDMACIITEPLGVNSGGIEPSIEFLKGLRALCDEYKIVLIFDEIITGFRMDLGGAQAYYDVTPDLSTFGKAMAGGMLPVAAVAGKVQIMDLLTQRRVVHAGTFNGYHAGLSAVNACLNILQGEVGGLSAVHENGRFLENIFKEAAGKYGTPLTIQGHPACFYMHVSEDKITAAENWNAKVKANDTLLQSCLLENGIMIAPISRCYPGVQMTDEEKEFLRINVDKAFAAFQSRYQP